MKLSDWGLCKPLDSSFLADLQINDGGANGSIPEEEEEEAEGSRVGRRTQAEQLSNWQKNRRGLVSRMAEWQNGRMAEWQNGGTGSVSMEGVVLRRFQQWARRTTSLQRCC